MFKVTQVRFGITDLDLGVWSLPESWFRCLNPFFSFGPQQNSVGHTFTIVEESPGVDPGNFEAYR